MTIDTADRYEGSSEEEEEDDEEAPVAGAGIRIVGGAATSGTSERPELKTIAGETTKTTSTHVLEASSATMSTEQQEVVLTSSQEASSVNQASAAQSNAEQAAMAGKAQAEADAAAKKAAEEEEQKQRQLLQFRKQQRDEEERQHLEDQQQHQQQQQQHQQQQQQQQQHQQPSQEQLLAAQQRKEQLEKEQLERERREKEEELNRHKQQEQAMLQQLEAQQRLQQEQQQKQQHHQQQQQSTTKAKHLVHPAFEAAASQAATKPAPKPKPAQKLVDPAQQLVEAQHQVTRTTTTTTKVVKTGKLEKTEDLSKLYFADRPAAVSVGAPAPGHHGMREFVPRHSADGTGAGRVNPETAVFARAGNTAVGSLAHAFSHTGQHQHDLENTHKTVLLQNNFVPTTATGELTGVDTSGALFVRSGTVGRLGEMWPPPQYEIIANRFGFNINPVQLAQGNSWVRQSRGFSVGRLGPWGGADASGDKTMGKLPEVWPPPPPQRVRYRINPDRIQSDAVWPPRQQVYQNE